MICRFDDEFNELMKEIMIEMEGEEWKVSTVGGVSHRDGDGNDNGDGGVFKEKDHW